MIYNIKELAFPPILCIYYFTFRSFAITVKERIRKLDAFLKAETILLWRYMRKLNKLSFNSQEYGRS